jgi:hypothetical protein
MTQPNVTRYTDDPESVSNALLLTDFDLVDADVVRGWTPDQRAAAFEWALRAHLHASDNDDVEPLPCPAHVLALRDAPGTRMTTWR